MEVLFIFMYHSRIRGISGIRKEERMINPRLTPEAKLLIAGIVLSIILIVTLAATGIH